MTLKDIIHFDNNNVFMNVDEMADTHLIDDKEVVCIVDNEQLQDNKIKSGTYKGQLLIHVPLSSLQGKYVQGAAINFDDEDYIVADVVESDGMITMTLDVNESY